MPNPAHKLKHLADRCKAGCETRPGHLMGICASCGGPTEKDYWHNCDRCYKAWETTQKLWAVVIGDSDA